MIFYDLLNDNKTGAYLTWLEAYFATLAWGHNKSLYSNSGLFQLRAQFGTPQK